MEQEKNFWIFPNVVKDINLESRVSVIPKQDKYKENHTLAHHIKSENQR